MALKKLCRCGNVIDITDRYCDACTQRVESIKRDSNRQYDANIRHKRDKKYTDFYHSPEWEYTREHVLSKHNNIDLYAYYIKNEIVTATTAHHIVELKDDWSLRLTISNLFPISESNHNTIHALYKRDKKGTQKLLRELLVRWGKEMNPN